VRNDCKEEKHSKEERSRIELLVNHY